jgi:hypothetical protein
MYDLHFLITSPKSANFVADLGKPEDLMTIYVLVDVVVCTPN